MAAPHPVIAPEGLDRMIIRFAPAMSLAANRAARAFRAALEGEAWPGVLETSVALVSVLVRFDPRLLPHDVLQARLAERLTDMAPPAPAGARRWTIPCAFGGADGPDLAEAAALAGVSVEAAVQDLCSEVEVLALGFAPGQPYLGELPGHWALPRRQTLNPQVPQGALVTAVRQCVLFANPSPTGWRQVGRTGFACFRPDAADPFPLAPGDRVRFAPVSAGRLAALIAEDPLGGGAVLEGAC
jgi:KipI family sensor histidine kinase inhibitor